MKKIKMGKKIATYAMAASMIGGALVGTQATGVLAATKQTNTTASYNKNMTSEDYKNMYADYISQFLQVPQITTATSRTKNGYILSTYEKTVEFKEVKYAQSYEVELSWNKDFVKDPETGFTPVTLKSDKNHVEYSSYIPLRYARVRADYGHGVYSKWSAVKNVEFK